MTKFDDSDHLMILFSGWGPLIPIGVASVLFASVVSGVDGLLMILGVGGVPVVMIQVPGLILHFDYYRCKLKASKVGVSISGRIIYVEDHFGIGYSEKSIRGINLHYLRNSRIPTDYCYAEIKLDVDRVLIVTNLHYPSLLESRDPRVKRIPRVFPLIRY